MSSPLVQRIELLAKEHPQKLAFIKEKMTYADFDQEIKRLRNLLLEQNLLPKSKVLVFLKPGPLFASSVFALFSIGAVPIFIDPGMNRKTFLKAIESTQADILLAENSVHFYSFFKSKHFKNIKKRLAPKAFAPGLVGLYQQAKKSYPTPLFKTSELGAILFTSGATGPAKGVETTQDILLEQTLTLQKLFSLNSSDIDYPAFPLFMLFTLSLGLSVVTASLNAAYPAKCKAHKISNDFKIYKPTFASGSPAIWKRLLDYAQKKSIHYESLTNLATFGAPINDAFLRLALEIFPHAQISTPYGATESLPVAVISAKERLRLSNESLFFHQQSALLPGTCVGEAVFGVQIKIIPITDDFLKSDNLQEYGPMTVGEILVHSPMTSPSYHLREDETKHSKFLDKEGRLWHRMGDLGYKDGQGRLWFCGRKSHLVKIKRDEQDIQLMPTDPWENYFTSHYPQQKFALIKVNTQEAGLVMEKEKALFNDHQSKAQLLKQIQNLCRKQIEKGEIRHVYLCPKFPVDTRHNIKIDRLLLSSWANQSHPQMEKLL